MIISSVFSGKNTFIGRESSIVKRESSVSLEEICSMFLQVDHAKLDVFLVSKQLVLACYKATRSFPSEEKFGITSQIRRAALSVHLNIAEGCSRKSLAERKRFLEIARGSAAEVDAALDIAVELNYCNKAYLTDFGEFLKRTFQMISKMIST